MRLPPHSDSAQVTIRVSDVIRCLAPSRGSPVSAGVATIARRRVMSPRVRRLGRGQAPTQDGSLCDEDRSEAWVSFASCRDAGSVESFNGTNSGESALGDVREYAPRSRVLPQLRV